MAINLQKGQKISLKKEAPKLQQLMCGLGWDVAKKSGLLGGLFQADFDLDASVFCLDSRNKLKSNNEIVYFGNLRHYSSAINHLGDNLTGAGDGDDEEINVNLPLIPSNISKLVFVVNIYEAMTRKQDFGQVENAFVRLVNMTNNQEIVRYTLSNNGYEGKTGMIMAELTRVGDDWEMMAKGDGIIAKSLGDIAKFYS
ncbi:TerD family protein [Geminocystis sp. GBBB08]|uniref:TerD family protein n=1 Tax=Geminocystis sp. GBBB08 TaxID=2604140 RepID=UPI0027E33B66|nr:TerD family protein [Geminocystis sp. GBBB08]MBL1210781.1 TerD family protein [Geminocystis sp. GBBB08]